jgi:ribosomal protein L37AE/L43A
MSKHTIQNQYPKCPYCGSNDLYRTGRKGLMEWFLHYVLARNPYRCKSCYERFFHRRFAHRPNEQLHHHHA